MDHTTTATTQLPGGVSVTKVTVRDAEGIDVGFVLDAPAEPLSISDVLGIAAELTARATLALAEVG